MAAYDKQFLDTDGLTTLVNDSWDKIQKVTKYYHESGTSGTAGFVKFLTVKSRVYMNHPLVVHFLSRGQSQSTMEVQWAAANNTTPSIHGFYHRRQSYTGTHGVLNVGYTYEDIDGVRYFHFWKKKNEGYGNVDVHVECENFYIEGNENTGLLTFPNEQSNDEPTGIVYATTVYDSVSTQTSYSAKGTATKVPQITTNGLGQVTSITEVDITGVPPASHTHGSITNDGKIGTTANLPVVTGTGGAVTTGSFSTTASAVGTSSAAGSANTFSRGDHVHSISLATGDSAGQVKIAGTNVSVNGWGNKTTQFSLGADSAGTRYYTMFARMSDSNTQRNGEAQVILASGAGIGATNMGTWEIIVSNRGSTASTPKATMTVRCINQTSQTAPTFGYYVDSTNHYIYFGVYSGAYRGNSTITILSNNGATLQDFGDSTTAPTGWTTVTATGVSSAVKLDTSRTIQTDLASTSSASFDGSANITPGVTGTLAIGNGGTGGTTVNEAQYNLLGAMPEASSNFGDASLVACRLVTPSTSNGALVYRTGSNIWSWVKGKLTSDTGVNISGNAATATSANLSITTDTTNGDKLQIGSGTAVNIANSKHAVSADSATKATQDGSGNTITSTYLKLSGGTMTGKLTVWGSKYTDDGTTCAIDMNNSNIIGLNALYTKDASDSASEGINFYRDATHWDTLWMAGGHLYFVPNRATGATTSAADSKKVAILPASITSGQIVVTDGTSGDVRGVSATDARTTLSVYSKSEVDSMLTGRISVVTSLPATGEPGVIYFVGPTGSGADQYEEYIWDGSAFIKVGEKSLDLSNYVNTLSSSGTGSVVTSLSKSGNTLTANLGNISMDNLSNWGKVSDVTVSSVVYHTWWPIEPTSSNQVYGVAFDSAGTLYRVYNNNGAYSVRNYAQDTTYTNVKLGQGYGTCATSADTAAKVVTLASYQQTTGGIVAIKFTNALCAGATLAINSTTAKPVYIKGTAVTAENAAAVSAGDLAYFMYDGTAYHLMGTDRAATNPIVNITRSGTTFTATRLDGSTFTFTQQDSDTTYTQEKLGQGYGTCSTAEATAAKVVTLSNYELVKNGVVAIKFSNGLCASATLNINSKGAKPVFINGTAATATTCKEVQAGDIALFIYDGTQYQFLVSDRVSKSAITGLSVSGRTITYTKADNSTGTITTQDTTYTFADSYDSSTNKGATVATVTNAINALDVSNITGFGAGKTLASLTETDGKIAATFQNISITKSQVSDFSHAHGNITNGGAITADGAALANGDSLVFVDSSDSSLVKKTSITFDGSTTNSMLSKKGEWSDTIAKARAVVDYGATSKAIEIGWGGTGVTTPTHFAVYTDSANGYNKAIKDCSLANVKKAINGTSVGSTTQPTYIDANGVPTVIGYTIATSVPSGAVFTDIKQNITLATTTKAYITGVSTTPTSTAQALTGLADTGVYLTTTAGELNATQFKVNEHCTMQYNSTKSSLDFVFS